MADGYGSALVGEQGKPPIRLGRKIDEFDLVGTIKTMRDAAEASTKKQADKIERNEEVTIPAISQLEQSIAEIQKYAASLSNDFETSTTYNVFKDFQISSSMQGGLDSSQYVDISVDNSLAQSIPSQAIRILKIARFDERVSSATITNSTAVAITSETEELGIIGSFSINGGDTITISETDTLVSVVNAINSSSSDVTARYIQDNSKFYLVLSHSQLSTPFTFTDTDNILANRFGIDVSSPVDAQNLQAQVAVDFTTSTGVVETKTMYYSANKVSNLIPGVTLTLKNVTGADNVYVSLTENKKAIFDSIITLFKQYNQIRETINRNMMRDESGNLLDKEAKIPDSPLILRLSNKLDSIFNATFVNPGEGDYLSWKDIGVTKTFKESDGFLKGTYTVDAAKLENSIASNLNGIKKLFGNYFESSNQNFSAITTKTISPVVSNKNISVSYTATADGSMARLLYHNDDYSVYEDTGYFLISASQQIIGPAGSVFEGLSIFAKNPVAIGDEINFTIQVSQGLALSIKQKTGEVVNKQNGEFRAEFERIKDQNKGLQKQISAAKEKVDRLEKKYNSNTARLYSERSRYLQFSKFLDRLNKTES